MFCHSKYTTSVVKVKQENGSESMQWNLNRGAILFVNVKFAFQTTVV